jgi:hypothetical protein
MLAIGAGEASVGAGTIGVGIPIITTTITEETTPLHVVAEDTAIPEFLALH